MTGINTTLADEPDGPQHEFIVQAFRSAAHAEAAFRPVRTREQAERFYKIALRDHPERAWVLQRRVRASDWETLRAHTPRDGAAS